MSDIFEKQLKAKLSELEPESGDMLDKAAIWQRIEAAQQPVKQLAWSPRLVPLAAALVCLLGIALLLKLQNDAPPVPDQPLVQQKSAGTQTTVHQVTEDIPTAVQAQPGEMIKKDNHTVLPHTAAMTTLKHEAPPQELPVPQEVKHLPVQDSDPPATQQIAVVQPKVIYLSDLEQEPVTLAGQTKRNKQQSRIARYIKGNVEQYAVTPPKITINQILSK